MECVPGQTILRFSVRQTKREKIIAFFDGRWGERLGSMMLHDVFGTSFRSRVSELNRDPSCPIVIKNKTELRDGREVSVYWAERK